MEKKFVEIKLFQVKPDKLTQFEQYVENMQGEQQRQIGCVSLRHFKRFYTIDGVELGQPPREISKIVKCVKYYSIWEFDTKEDYGAATKWYFDNHYKNLAQLLIAPFDISVGYSL